MNFHEYQSKQLLAEYGIPVPAGKVAATPDEAVAAANSLGQGPWMVKAQIHAGGRGKAGGVKFCKTTDDVKAAAAKMLGTKMATYQTAGVELPVNLVLVTTAGVRALGEARQLEILKAVAEFDRFDGDNDPYGEHDFGAVDLGPHRLFWKIDYYDQALTNHSPDPANPTLTKRVLTIMLAEEY